MLNIMNRFYDAVSPAAVYIAIGACVFCIVLLIILLIQISKRKQIEQRLALFMQGSNAESLEEVLKRVLEDNNKVKIQLKNNVNEILKINENLVTAYRKIGIVKYNAFPGMAGKVSSCIALLNNENNGIVINSIHGQEGCYTYVKEIMNGKSINPLTKEDEEALKIAMQMEI